MEHDEQSADGRRGAVLRQRTTSAPHGLAGHLYWWAVAASHGIGFGGMVRAVARAAEGQ